MVEDIKKLLPGKFIPKLNEHKLDDVCEIRLRVGKPLVIVEKRCEYACNGTDNLCVTSSDVEYVLSHISGYSMYAFPEQLRQGFITILGGHRVGFSGRCVCDSNGVMMIKNISCINIRVAHQIIDCSEGVMPYIVENDRIRNTLIIAPPGRGKTTLLRDMIRNVSNGNDYTQGVNVGVVDERSEIGACYMGVPQNDIGLRTDILDACPKASGMLMLLRGMNPKVIACDEIGSREDIDAICHVINSGCAIFATVHGESMDDVRLRPVIREMIDKKVFERYILLRKKEIGIVDSIFDERGNELYSNTYYGSNFSVQPA